MKLPRLGSSGIIALAMRKDPPKLPRFKAPKIMVSRVFLTKKDKSRARRTLNKATKEEW